MVSLTASVLRRGGFALMSSFCHIGFERMGMQGYAERG